MAALAVLLQTSLVLANDSTASLDAGGLTLTSEEGNYDLGGRDPVNVMDFQVTAEGKQVEPSVEIKATRFGVDVTDMLKRYDTASPNRASTRLTGGQRFGPRRHPNIETHHCRARFRHAGSVAAKEARAPMAGTN